MIYDISVPFQNFPLAEEKHLIQGSTSLDSREKKNPSIQWVVGLEHKHNPSHDSSYFWDQAYSLWKMKIKCMPW